MSEILKAIVIGAGDRGADIYGSYALRHPNEIKFIAVAEPIAERTSTGRATLVKPPAHGSNPVAL